MIGIFDSGFGGLQTLKYFKQILPEYDYIFLADTKNNPYWVKNPNLVKELTFRCLNRLFDNGAKIVILACNTASVCSIREWQSLYPDKKVLSVTIPAIEKLAHKNYLSVGILATELTVRSWIYLELSQKFWLDTKPFQSICAGDIVEAIELGKISDIEIEKMVRNYISIFDWKIDCLILWCTHFSIWRSYFEKFFSWEIIDPSLLSAYSMVSYLQKHNYSYKLPLNWNLFFYTTGNLEKFCDIWSKIFGEIIEAKFTKT